MIEDAAATLDLRVRTAVYDGTITDGTPPSIALLERRLEVPREDVLGSLERLGSAHVLVLQPHSREILMANPFSAVPTPFAVRAAGRLYWANCIWDAMGIAAMLRCDARIDCSCGRCGEAMPVAVAAGELEPVDGVVHFAIPARSWWLDIVFN